MKILLSSFILFMFLSNESCNQTTPKASSDQGKDVVDIKSYLDGQTFDGMEHAIVAGGCFWCVEAAFQQIEGVVEAISGYSGGKLANPSYREVCTHTTGHTEAVYLIYDPAIIDFNTILNIFFDAHDPTTKDRQGPDVGNSYRSALFYLDENQKASIDSKIAELNESTFNGKIVTEVSNYEEFWVAEAYHQDFYWINPTQGYVQSVSRPKVQKVAKIYKERLKKNPNK